MLKRFKTTYFKCFMQLYTVLNKTRNICLVFLFNQNCSTVFRVFHFNMHENSKYMVHICTSQGQFQKQSVRLGVRLFSIKDIHLNNFFYKIILFNMTFVLFNLSQGNCIEFALHELIP